MENIKVGVRYEPLGGEVTNVEEHLDNKHWVLVFSGKTQGFKLQAGATARDTQGLSMTMSSCLPSYDAHPLGTFHGAWSDLLAILEVHPQKGTVYSPAYNNSQHFVAIYLLFLKAYANRAPGRSISILYDSRYNKIENALNKSEDYAWNCPNPLMAFRSCIPMLGGATAATAGASGLLGWLGGSTSIATAGFSFMFAPVAAAGATLMGAAYYNAAIQWKEKSRFDNPLITGYPGNLPSA